MSTKENTEFIELVDVGPEADLERPPPPLTPRAIVQKLGERVAKAVVRRKSQGRGTWKGKQMRRKKIH